MKLQFTDQMLLNMILKDIKNTKPKFVANLVKRFGRLTSQETTRVTYDKINPATGEPMYTDHVVLTYERATVTTTKYGRVLKVVKNKPVKETAKPVKPPVVIVKKKRVFTK